MLTTQQIQKVTIPIEINLCDNDKLTLEFSSGVRKPQNLYKIGKRIPHNISGNVSKTVIFLTNFPDLVPVLQELVISGGVVSQVPSCVIMFSDCHANTEYSTFATIQLCQIMVE